MEVRLELKVDLDYKVVRSTESSHDNQLASGLA